MEEYMATDHIMRVQVSLDLNILLVKWSSLVAHRVHNPKVNGSIPFFT